MTQTAIAMTGVSVRLGHTQALSAVTLEVRKGEIVCLLGANGAGKTTTLRTLSGLNPFSGSIEVDGRQIQGLPPYKLARLGLAHVPQGRRVFPGLTVEENLRVAAAHWATSRQACEEPIAQVHALFPRLVEKKDRLAWSLSGGEQQMLAMGRAMMSKPKIIMLDEPSLGLAPNLVDAVLGAVVDFNRTGVTVFLVEQNAALALEISHRGYVLENGRVVMEGPCEELLRNKAVQSAYLGA